MTVVVGYIPTPEGQAALDAAAQEARRRKAKLAVVNTSRGDAYIDRTLVDEQEMGKLREHLRNSGVDVEIHQPIRGQDAVQEILGVVDSTNADLLVIGMRRRTPVGKLILGSTAQRLLLQSPCPVLAVKTGHDG